MNNDSASSMSNLITIDSLEISSKQVSDGQQRSPHQTPVQQQSSPAHSHVSRVSSQSVTSSELARKRAVAQAARAKAQYALKEADLRKQQAALVVDLDLLKSEKEAAVAEAEYQALESAYDDFRQPSIDAVDINLPAENSVHRTTEYVLQHQKVSDIEPLNKSRSQHSDLLRNSAAPAQYHTCGNNNQNLNAAASVFVPTSNHAAQPLLSHHPVNYDYHNSFSPLPAPKPSAQTFPVEQHSSMSDLTRFLLKKDLLMSRLSVFDDKPESYNVWKASFKSIICELQVTPSEEMDLLVRYLGPESSRHANSLRAASFNNPEKGIFLMWERLDERYGSPELLESALMGKLNNFPKLTNKDCKKLYDLVDILSEIQAVKEQPQYSSLLSYFDTSSGTVSIISKLPYGIQEKWTYRASQYKRQHSVMYPPFTFLLQFIREISQIKNDPSFLYQSAAACISSERTQSNRPKPTTAVKAHKIDVSKQDKASNPPSQETKCPLHGTRHTLNQCRGFRSKPLEERKQLIKEYKLCLRCCSSAHFARDCKEQLSCAECSSDTHPSALHPRTNPKAPIKVGPYPTYGGENDGNSPDSKPVAVSSKCTQICKSSFKGKSCSKTVLVRVYPKDQPSQVQIVYAIIDDQSNSSLAKSDFFDMFHIQTDSVPYTLSSCAGTVKTSGRRANGFVLQELNGTTCLELPQLIECDQIPDSREEIPTPDIVSHHSHLKNIAKYLPPLSEAPILLLIGRDLTRAHHVLDQRIGPRNSPYAQRLPLGWVIIGEVCLGKIHQSDFVCVNKTQLLPGGRPSIFSGCPSSFTIRENIFQITPDDLKPGLSTDNRRFLAIMDENFVRNSNGDWVAPLPFQTPRPKLPNNRQVAVKRALMLDRNLKKNPEKRKHFIAFMEKIFANDHAEVAPALTHGEECWYLPLFGVYHPHKPNQIRGVFDASAQFAGVSLNNVLLSGPDHINSLLGILIRFRKEAVAITADIEHMFYCFKVREDHRNYLRFLWYSNNNFEEGLVEYRMTVHVFGCTSSPAIATYGLRKIAEISRDDFGVDVNDFVSHDFYVDDGITSCPSSDQALSLLKRTQEALKCNGNLRLHKISSNKKCVMSSFEGEDLAKELKDLDLGSDTLPTQKSLGLSWDLQADSFTFRVSTTTKPYTRRGLLSTVNSLYDPLGFAAPVVIQGKVLLRNLIADTKDWDEPLPPEHQQEWEHWRDSLNDLESLLVPRPYTAVLCHQSSAVELHVYCDASEKIIAAAAYIKSVSEHQQVDVGFILGKAKLAPKHGNTIPRLELCSAVLAAEIADIVTDHIKLRPEVVQFHTDSKVVLGYIGNTSRKFNVYVSNRVDRILRTSRSNQWCYVPSSQNPADVATRYIPARELQESLWLRPTHLQSTCEIGIANTDTQESLDFNIEPSAEVVTLQTIVNPATLGSTRFRRFSSWSRLVNAITLLLKFLQARKSKCSSAESMDDVDRRLFAERLIIQVAQQDEFQLEIDALKNGKNIPKTSRLIKLDPFMHEDGLLHIGGRLNRSGLPQSEKNPIIIPGNNHIAILLIRHYHDKVKHQGRHFTEGSLRAAGYWIIGGKRLISSVIHKCVKCRKLRGTHQQQKMADLPPDRLQPAPPFTFVGVDTFGPWHVSSRRTRGGQSNSKRWAVLFTCLTTRAIHIEVVEEMSSSSFINSLRRFTSLRGNVKEFRSDRGTNFIGATDDLRIDSVNVEDGPTKAYLYNSGTKWTFNPPHSSHMGGVWERMIGITRRILNSMMADMTTRHLTHEVLSTFMAEVTAIVNARPITSVSSDPENPEILTPSRLLTMKCDQSPPAFTNLDLKDLYKSQWRCVQSLADTFWKRWRTEYLQTIQPRQKWHEGRPNIKGGDIVLLKEKNAPRNHWPIAIVLDPIAGGDDRVRKAVVRTTRNDKAVEYTRPISEMILLTS